MINRNDQLLNRSEIIPSRTDVLSMAREAHRELVTLDYPGHMGQLDPWTMRLLERFAALIASRVSAAAKAEEREACAKVCEVADKSTHPADLADAIRARRQA